VPILPDCPGQPFLPDPYGHDIIEIESPPGSGCIVKFRYCWRKACGTLNDIYIEIIGTTCDPGPFFDPSHYKKLVEACMAHVVAVFYPWGSGGGIENIPPCSEGLSQTIWRLGTPSCTSDWFVKWIDGKLYFVTEPCNVVELGTTCWNTVKYCWIETEYGKELIPKVQSTGAPGIWQCPPIYKPDGYQNVECNALCE